MKKVLGAVAVLLFGTVLYLTTSHVVVAQSGGPGPCPPAGCGPNPR